jgi:hypothetical protein
MQLCSYTANLASDLTTGSIQRALSSNITSISMIKKGRATVVTDALYNQVKCWI